jgi:hypothetical protein
MLTIIWGSVEPLMGSVSRLEKELEELELKVLGKVTEKP